jgi:toxin ParE1/3/4
MPTYRLTQRARRDLVEIWSYIAEDNEAAADRIIDLLVAGFRILGQNPRLGRSRDDLRQGCRSFVVAQYVIVYRVANPGVQILHVLHGKRDIPGLFRQ